MDEFDEIYNIMVQNMVLIKYLIDFDSLILMGTKILDKKGLH